MAYSAHSSHSDDVLSEPGSLEPFESSLLSSGRVVQEEEESLTTTTLSLSKNNLSSSVKAPCSPDESDPWLAGRALLSEKLASISKGKDCLLNDQSGRSSWSPVLIRGLIIFVYMYILYHNVFNYEVFHSL